MGHQGRARAFLGNKETHTVGKTFEESESSTKMISVFCFLGFFFGVITEAIVLLSKHCLTVSSKVVN